MAPATPPVPTNAFLDGIPSSLREEVFAEFRLTERRGGRLPLPLVLQLVVAMALRPDRSIPAVLEELVGVVGEPLTWRGAFPQPSSITSARDRLGWKPVKRLFEAHSELTDEVFGAPCWKGLRVGAVDGTTMRTPDSAANQVFGRPGGRNGASGFPAVRLLALVDVDSHQVRAAAVGPSRGVGSGELSVAHKALLDVIPPDTVLLFDRGFCSFAWLRALDDREVPFVVRAKTGKNAMKPVIRETLQRKADWQAEFPIPQRFPDRKNQAPIPLRLLKWTPPKKRSKRTKGSRKRPKSTCRKAKREAGGKKKGKRQVVLLTNLTDPCAYSYEEIVGLYLKRWEVEFAFREIKTTLTNRKVEFRSKLPERVLQEAYALLLAYNLVRARITQASSLGGLSPTRLSFKDCLLATRGAYVTGRALQVLLKQLQRYLLPKREPRNYPRAVKCRATRYPTKPNANAA
tara:strand:- start:45 stop:1421 length:1377 start_codon:yes stop_codon:yes gene_type:complete